MTFIRKLGWKTAVISLVVLVGLLVLLQSHQAQAPERQPTRSQTSHKPQSAKDRYPVDQAKSLWAVVNKGRRLPSTYQPSALRVPAVELRGPVTAENMQLRSDAATALEKLFTAAKRDGYKLMLTSGYRSYTTQVAVHNDLVARHGLAEGEKLSAKAGYSEHQTGLAADVEPASRDCELNQCFGDTAEGQWLVANAYGYGFIIRYGRGQEHLTGYEYEPWHLRYVGTDLAKKLYNSGQTLEQYFGLPTYTTYVDNSLVLR